MNPLKNRPFSLVILALAAAGAGPAPKTAPYAFTLDGHAFDPDVRSLNGTPDTPAEGDVLVISGVPIMLGAPGRYDFKEVFEAGMNTRILLHEPGGRWSVAAASTHWDWDDQAKKKRIVDTTAKLSDKQWGELRGLRIDGWPKGYEKRLARLHLETTCVTVTGESYRGEEGALPPLPPGLRCLLIDESGTADHRDLSGLAKLKHLRLLAVSLIGKGGHFDAALVKDMQGLRHLDLLLLDRRPHLSHVEDLGRLPELATLRLWGLSTLTDLGFLRTLKTLRRLDIRNTGVKDLTPIGDLPLLAFVDANGAPVDRLPPAAPKSLMTLRIINAKVAEKTVAEFARTRPAARIAHKRGASLRQAWEAAAIDEVRIVPGPLLDQEELPAAQRAKPVTVKDRSRVRALLTGLVFDEGRPLDDNCDCDSAVTLELRSQGQPALALDLVERGITRWPHGDWPGIAMLTPAAWKSTRAWLQAQSFQALERSLDKARDAEADRWAKLKVFADAYPAGIRRHFVLAKADEDGNVKGRGKLVAKEVGDPVKLVVFTSRALGALPADEDVQDFNEQIGRAAVRDGASAADFLGALPELGPDKAALRGAAELYFEEGFLARVPAAKGDPWTARLAEIALTTGSDRQKSSVLQALAEHPGPAVEALLARLEAGKTGAAPRDGADNDPGLPAHALLDRALIARAKPGEKTDELRKTLHARLGKTATAPDKAAYETALALLGEAGYVKKEHFKLNSDVIGLALIKAIEGFHGREGLALLLTAADEGNAGVAFEGIFAFQRIVGKQWCKPGERPDSDCMNAARAWWKGHGNAFVQASRAAKK